MNRLMLTTNADLLILNKLVGKWAIEGWFKSDPDTTVSGWETYSWLPGGHFLQSTAETNTNNKGKEVGKYESMMIIGRNNAEAGQFTGHLFDDGGNRGEWLYEVTEMVFNVSNAHFRFTGKFNEDNTVITGYWEVGKGNNEWKFWYDKKLIKQQ
jgi:hypothetical protein